MKFLDLKEVFKKMKYFMSWNEYDEIIQKIYEDIKHTYMDLKPYEAILTFPRGGYIPAAHLANLLDIHHIITDPMEALQVFEDNQILVVDDISDTGKTLMKDYTPFRDIACVCYKKSTRVKPTFYSVCFEDDTWIVFPWEHKDSKEERDHK